MSSKQHWTAFIITFSNTFRSEPSGYPSNLRVLAKTLFSVTFKWNELECHKQNGPITGYEFRVYYAFWRYIEGVLGPKTTVHTLYVSNTELGGYALSVAAINEASIGEYSSPCTVLYTELGILHVQPITYHHAITFSSPCYEEFTPQYGFDDSSDDTEINSDS